jgi:5-methylcytosine-specific restriction endonuclease McrA
MQSACLVCGGVIPDGRRKFCSRACLKFKPLRKEGPESCLWCGSGVSQERGKGRTRRWCSDVCRNNAKAQRRRMLIPDASEQARAYVIQRDGGKCQMCGVRCTTKRDDYKRRLAIDHIVPVSRGGTNDPINLRVTCWDCNSRRGADRLPAQLALIG